MTLRIGLVGTGYAAKARAEALHDDSRAQLVAISGHTPEKTAALSQAFQMEIIPSWADLVQRSDIDLVVICTINRDHAAVAHSALMANKHVVVEYPLALDVVEAERLIALAQNRNRLLHIEHIELLSGIHQTIRQHLPAIGTPFYARYSTINPQHPGGSRWTYRDDLFGFPFLAALARLSRLIDLFGKVESVTCQSRYWSAEGFGLSHWTGLTTAYAACLCNAQLRFSSGLLADLTYGKGETFWQPSRLLDIQGDQGALIIDGDVGQLLRKNETIPLEVGSRRGLFARDTAMVLDHLLEGVPLYVQPSYSLYALRVGDAARRAAETGQTIKII